MIGRLSIFAILFGLAASTVAGLLIGVIGGVALAVLSPSDIHWFGAPSSVSPSASIVALLIAASSMGSLAAGYTSARIAIGDELINAFATGMALLIITMASYQEPWFHQLPASSATAIAGLSIPLSLLGGYLQRGKASA